MRIGTVAGVRLTETTATEYEVIRTPKLIRRSDPETCGVQVLTYGQIGLEQGGDQTILRPGELSIIDHSRPFSILGMSDRKIVNVTFRKTLLPVSADLLAQLTGARIPARPGTAGLVSSLLRQLLARLDEDEMADNAWLALAVVDLIAAGIASRLDRGAKIGPERRQRAMFLRIHAYIDKHLGEPTLAPAAIAAAHHISARYLRKLFEANGETVTDRIRNHRLARCRRDLLDPALTDLPVAAIARRWGFTSAAHFTRVFREAYGLPPAAYRHTHRQLGSHRQLPAAYP